MQINVRKLFFIVFLTFLVTVSLPLIPISYGQRYSWVTLTVSTNMYGAGYVTPNSGNYYYGDNIVARVYTYSGYSFDGWYLNGVYQGKLSSIPLTMTQNYELVAVFSKRVVALTVTANPPEAATLAPGSGVWTYTYGDSVTAKQFPNPGYTFSGWYLDGNYLGAGTSITVNMDRDHQLSAFFAGQGTTPPPTNAPTPTPTPTPSPSPSPTPTPKPNLPKPELIFFTTSSTKFSGFNVKIEGALSYNQVGLSGAGIMFSYSVTGGKTWQDLAYVITGDNGSFSAVWMPSASGNYALKATWQGDGIYSNVTKVVNFAVAAETEESMFTVASNSTLSSLAFDSTKSELSFGVSGPSQSVGYVQVCIPKTMMNNVTALKVTFDGLQLDYSTLSAGDVWLISMVYPHSSHKVVMALGSEAGAASGKLLGEPWIIAIIAAVLVTVIAALVVVRGKINKKQNEPFSF